MKQVIRELLQKRARELALMKNPLEYTLSEVEAMLQADDNGPHREFTALLLYVHERQKYLHDYQVQKTRELVSRKEPVSIRKVRSLDAELLDSAEIVTLESEADYSQAPTGDKYDKLIERMRGR